MKKNLPITNSEVPYPEGEEIISTTSLKGIITSFNNTFQKISGFEADELINKNHNVIRHPEMPPAAFDDLWKAMKSIIIGWALLKIALKMVIIIGLMAM
ncbi:PAS domain S-box protein [Methylophaga muralis]|uniref:Aerotaxis receptor n=1 Tax=Methylophaga muralis TaxID=291169 RepID=A0A1E3GUB3_9GAMM|nr:PAS domain S-box protein [Methylophaga muralis]ODN66951.1 Aerotaxis receptor [Methylophaga muralis]